LLVFIAFAIAVPVGYYLTDQWLQNFSYQTTVPVGIYVLVMAVSLLITAATVGYRAMIAALGNPVDSLADE
jgi:hypothetical protein